MNEANAPCQQSQWLAQWLTSTTSLMLALALTTGCATWPLGTTKERTSLITPSMRAATIREIGARAEDADSTEQTRLVEQLADQIRVEPDPVVRQAIQASIAKFPGSLSRDVLIAGLNDKDLHVRLICCHQLSKRPEPTTAAALRRVVEQEEDLDVRLAAVTALGGISSVESVAALSVALNDRDPAMQYAAVESLKLASGQDLGNDVQAWRTYAAGDQPQILVANKKSGFSPF